MKILAALQSEGDWFEEGWGKDEEFYEKVLSYFQASNEQERNKTAESILMKSSLNRKVNNKF